MSLERALNPNGGAILLGVTRLDPRTFSLTSVSGNVDPPVNREVRDPYASWCWVSDGPGYPIRGLIGLLIHSTALVWK